MFTSFLLLFTLSTLILFSIISKLNSKTPPKSSKIPTSYPIIGSIFAIVKNKERRVQWIAEITNSTPNLTFALRRPFGYVQLFTANPLNVQHILKSHFYNYPKGETFRNTLRDFLGDSIFNSDGENWKFLRQVSSHQFNTRSLRRFVETVVEAEITDRLIPILKSAADGGKTVILDLQDLLQRFAFDNICRIAFGYDPACLLPSLPKSEFAVAFDRALRLVSERFNSNVPFVWKIKRALSVGREKELRATVGEVREFAASIVREKKRNLNNADESDDLLSRFLKSGHVDEDFVVDIVISFILAGRDTSSAALTWFFWLISKNPNVEREILNEIEEGSSSSRDMQSYDEVKNMVYTHSVLCETMRLYPPVPVSTKSALEDDVMPDGTFVRKGTRISYHPYAMGRAERVWGADWAEFRPERWLVKRSEEGEGGCGGDGGANKWGFVGKDYYSYPVFQAGPRICLGKDMAFLQMKMVASCVLRKFRVSPAVDGFEPVYISDFTSKMKGGFLVKIEERV